MQGCRASRFCGPPFIAWRGLRVVRASVVRLKIRAPDITGPPHFQGIEDQARHDAIEGFAGGRFHDLLEPEEPFTRIAESFARLEIRLERVRLAAPVRQTGCLAKDMAYGD